MTTNVTQAQTIAGGRITMPSKAELEEKYYEITELYDLADELVGTVESEFATNPEAQFELVEPLIDDVGAATDVLTEEFMVIAESNGRTRNKNKIEGALRKIYRAIDAYHARVDASVGESKTGFRNIADPIVKKLKRQMESVIATFIEFVELSLDRIMHKSEIDDLKQRQEKIAMMLHNIAQGQAT